MTTPIEKKYKIIEQVMKIEDNAFLQYLEESIIYFKEKFSSKPLFWKAIKPPRKGISLDQILKEQNYKPMSFVEFRKQAEEIQIEEPIEDLLAQLD